MSKLSLNAKQSALLVMDFQTPVVERFSVGRDAVLDATAAAISAARSVGMRVIYIVVGFRPGFPEISDRNQRFKSIKDTGGLASDVHARVAPAPGEVVVTKHRVSAFAGTELDMILRANDVDTLVLAGIATSGVVLSTVRHAADADYGLVILRDCCSDLDPDVHSCLLDKIFPGQAVVSDSDEFIQALG